MKSPAKHNRPRISDDPIEMRRRAEGRPRKRTRDQKLDAGKPRLLRKLEVHRNALARQTAELQESRDAIESALERHAGAYEHAPAGFLTLAADGIIRMANLTGASLAGIDRSRLLGRTFEWLISVDLRPVFISFLKQVFASQAKQSGDFELLSEGKPPRTVQIEAQRSHNAQECYVVMVDITERKSAENKMRISEIRYRRLFEAAHDGVLLLDPGTSKITDANPFMTKLLGYSRDQLIGKELFEIGLLKDEAASREMFRNLKKKHEVRYEDLPLETQRGRHQEVEVVANVYDENGHPVIQCNIRDITERKKAEMASIRLAAIVESSDDAIISKDPNDIITSWNVGAERIFGYTADEMVGTSIMRLIPADRRDEENQILKKIKRGERLHHFDTLRKTKDGRLINVSVTASPIQNASGKIIGVSKVARDITERKQAEDLLRRNEALFSSLLEQAPVGVYVVDAGLRMRQVNPMARPVFKKVGPLIGRDLSEVMHVIWPKPVADRVVKRFRRTLKTGVPYQSPDFAERRRDIEVRESYEWQIQRVILPAGEYGVVCFFTNTTERKRSEEAQRRLEVLSASNRKLEQEIVRRQAVQESLKKSEQDQSLLLEQSRHMQEQLRSLSHQILHAHEEERKRISRDLHDEIAQSLVGINVRLATLAREATASPRGLQQKIAHTQQSVEKSVEKVHQFARQLRPALLDDLGLIPALNAFMKGFTEQTGVRTKLTAFAAVERLDTAKRTVLFRVAQEALTNVARHAQAGRVEVIIQRLPEGLCMIIKDDGKSFQVDRVMHGKGRKHLGLLGMKERLEMVRGSFEVESAPGHGTTITATIPSGKAARLDAPLMDSQGSKLQSL